MRVQLIVQRQANEVIGELVCLLATSPESRVPGQPVELTQSGGFRYVLLSFVKSKCKYCLVRAIGRFTSRLLLQCGSLAVDTVTEEELGRVVDGKTEE